MKRYFKTFSLLLVIAMLVTSSAFAYGEDVVPTEAPNTLSTVADTQVDLIEIANDTIVRKGDEIFYNGTKIATITTTVTYSSDTIEPRTGWVYGDGTCPEGASPSDYNELFTTREHDVAFEKAATGVVQDALKAALSNMVPFAGPLYPVAVFKDIIASIEKHIAEYEDDNHIYSVEYIYAGGIPYTRKNVFHFYNDPEHKNYEGTATCYSWWG